VTGMTIGQLAARTGLSVRTLRFYADAGVLPEATRSAAGYRLFAPESVPRARLVRTLRELGVGLDDVKRVLAAEASVAEVAAAHARALDAQIRRLRLQRAVLGAVARSTDPQELERMTDLTTITAAERRRIVDNYLDAVFGDYDSAVVDRLRIGAPELPEEPTADQVAAWVELAELLRDPDYITASRRMAQRARAEGPQPDVTQFEVSKAVGEHAGAAASAGVDPRSREALAVVERLEAMAPGEPEDRAKVAERIQAFTDRRVARYWTLVGIVNGWPQTQTPTPEYLVGAWEWYAHALRAHARQPHDDRRGPLRADSTSVTADEIIALVSAMPGVVVDTASETTGAPEVAWGDSFFFYDPDGDPANRRLPFATIVTKDYAGFDTASDLNRPGVFRLNIAVGRRRYQDLTGHTPAAHGDHHAEFDYTDTDRLLPHPVYAAQGWIAILNPGQATFPRVSSLLIEARARAAERHKRRSST